jgi:formylglycine-generating enzyme required for sulfatase activity
MPWHILILLAPSLVLSAQVQAQDLKAAASKKTFKDCVECPVMIVVPAGQFMMGTPEGEPKRVKEHEAQVRVSIIKPFAVGVFAVTRGEFAAFASATRHKADSGCYTRTGAEWKEQPHRSWRSPGFAQDDRHPVTCINWNDAKAYVSWLSSKTGKTYRLLSEAEREYVTRAGTTTPFWWGSSLSANQANYKATDTYGEGTKGQWRQRTVRVDSFRANAWGLYNVHGNAWDWTEDCWSDKNTDNPRDGSARTTGDCNNRVVRGGAWAYSPDHLRAGFRYWNQPHNRNSGQSFRVARTL